MSISAGVSGVRRDLSSLHTGTGGEKRELNEVYAGNNGAKRLIYQSVRVIGDLPVGSIIKLNENGTPVNYLIVHQGLPSSIYDTSCNGTWLLRNDIPRVYPWHTSLSNELASSYIHAYLNGDWMDLYDYKIKSTIKQIKIPYRGGSTNFTGNRGLSCKVFLLSGYEVGYIPGGIYDIPEDGNKLSYFYRGDGSTANKRRIAKQDGRDISWWLRSKYTFNGNYNGAWAVSEDGNGIVRNVNESRGLRPALILPKDLKADQNGNILV